MSCPSESLDDFSGENRPIWDFINSPVYNPCSHSGEERSLKGGSQGAIHMGMASVTAWGPSRPRGGVSVSVCGAGCSVSLIIHVFFRKGRAGSQKMISTDLLLERTAKAEPSPTALGQRGLPRGRPQGSSALLTWKGCRCRPRRARSPKHHPNGNRRASAWCTAGRWVCAATHLH